jgi:excisionase family DNA binding protein
MKEKQDSEAVMSDKKRTLNTLDICELTGIGRDRVRALILSGALPNIGSRRRPRVPRTVVERWLETGQLKEVQQ